MPSISSCPECHRDLTIPDLDSPDRRLRCPLCEAQFSAARILADSVAFPPLALLVDEADSSVLPAAVAGPMPIVRKADDSDRAATDVCELPPVYEREPPPAETPWQESESSDAAATALPLAGDDSTGSTEPDESEIDVTIEDDEASVLAPHDGVLSRDERPHHASGVDVVGDATVSTGAASSAIEIERPSFRVAARPRRRVSASGAIVQLLGMAAGGAVGLAIGYWILLWINPRADFLELRGKLPGWMVPGGRRHSSVDREPAANRTEAAAPWQRSLAEPSDAADASLVSESELPNAVQHVDFDGTDVSVLSGDPHSAQTLPEEPAATAIVGPRGFTLHDSAQLNSAIDAATRALRCKHCPTKQPRYQVDDDEDAPVEAASEPPARQTPRCDHCRGAGIGNITAEVFERLCQLAETATFAKLDEVGDEARDKYRNAVQDLMLLVGADRDRGQVIGRLAANRLDNSQRPSNGVIVCGSVAQTRYQGELFVMRIVLSGIARTVTVVSRDAPQPPFGPRDHVLILGSIIDSPANNLAGYEGDEPQVIWGGVPFKLAGP